MLKLIWEQKTDHTYPCMTQNKIYDIYAMDFRKHELPYVLVYDDEGQWMSFPITFFKPCKKSMDMAHMWEETNDNPT